MHKKFQVFYRPILVQWLVHMLLWHKKWNLCFVPFKNIWTVLYYVKEFTICKAMKQQVFFSANPFFIVVMQGGHFIGMWFLCIIWIKITCGIKWHSVYFDRMNDEEGMTDFLHRCIRKGSNKEKEGRILVNLPKFYLQNILTNGIISFYIK